MNVIVNKTISIKEFLIVTIFAILLGLVMIYIATKGFINVNILKNYKKGLAKINYSEIVELGNDEHSTSQWKVKYIYFVDNQQYEGENLLWWKFSDKNIQVGDKI